MIYAATITLPASTAEADAVQTDLIVTRGLLWLVEVGLPPGCAGLVHVQLFDATYQVFPATPGESFHGDGVLRGYDDLYMKSSAPFLFQVKAWNLDTVYSHTISVRLGMASSNTEISRYMPGVAWENLTEAIANMEAVQTATRAAQLAEIQKSLEGLNNG